MSDRFSVQVRKKTVGIAVRSGGGFRFYASEPQFFALEGQSFATLRTLILAAEEHSAASPDEMAHPAPLRASSPPKRLHSPDPPGASDTPRPMAAGTAEAPEWFRWAFYAGLAATAAVAAAVASAVS